jgi:hypothetical protein
MLGLAASPSTKATTLRTDETDALIHNLEKAPRTFLIDQPPLFPNGSSGSANLPHLAQLYLDITAYSEGWIERAVRVHGQSPGG